MSTTGRLSSRSRLSRWVRLAVLLVALGVPLLAWAVRPRVRRTPIGTSLLRRARGFEYDLATANPPALPGEEQLAFPPYLPYGARCPGR